MSMSRSHDVRSVSGTHSPGEAFIWHVGSHRHIYFFDQRCRAFEYVLIQ